MYVLNSPSSAVFVPQTLQHRRPHFPTEAIKVAFRPISGEGKQPH